MIVKYAHFRCSPGQICLAMENSKGVSKNSVIFDNCIKSSIKNQIFIVMYCITKLQFYICLQLSFPLTQMLGFISNMLKMAVWTLSTQNWTKSKTIKLKLNEFLIEGIFSNYSKLIMLKKCPSYLLQGQIQKMKMLSHIFIKP